MLKLRVIVTLPFIKHHPYMGPNNFNGARFLLHAEHIRRKMEEGIMTIMMIMPSSVLTSLVVE